MLDVVDDQTELLGDVELTFVVIIASKAELLIQRICVRNAAFVHDLQGDREEE